MTLHDSSPQRLADPRPASLPSHGVRALVVLATLATLAVALLPPAAAADSLRCDGKLIRAGDPTARLIEMCGQPVSRDVVAVLRAYDDGEQIRSIYAEDWSYPTPDVDGYRVLRFEGGRLVSEGMRCDKELVRTGDTTVTVLKRCGEPVTRDAAGLVDESPPGPASRAIVGDTPIEQWVYSQGEGNLLKILILRGGRVESIEDGPRE